MLCIGDFLKSCGLDIRRSLSLSNHHETDATAFACLANVG